MALSLKFMMQAFSCTPVIGLFCGMTWASMTLRGKGDFTSTMFNTDTTNLEKVTFSNATIASRAVEGSIESVVAGFANALFYPLLAIPHLGFKVNRKVFVFVLCLSYSVYVCGFVIVGNRSLLESFGAYSALFFFLALKLFCPNSSHLRWAVARQIAVVAIAFGFLTMTREIPLTGTTAIVVRYLVLFPLLREVTRTISIGASWRLAKSKDSPHIFYSVFFTSSVQLVFAFFYRFQVANVSDSLVRIIITVLQGVLEVVLRITVVSRDEKMSRLLAKLQKFARCFPASRQVRDAPSKDSWQAQERSAEEKVRQSFYSALVYLEMYGEYVAIIGTPVLMFSFRSVPIFMPFQVFASPELGSTLTASDMVFMLWSQAIVEIVVDTGCIMWETRSEALNFRECSDGWPKYTFLFQQLQVWFALVASLGLVHFGDSFDNCQGTDMCCCLGNGLVKGGVRELYCFLTYNSSNISEIKQNIC